MKMFKRVFALALVLAMSLSLVACSGSIEGEWVMEEDGGEVTYEFGDDGKGSVKQSGVSIEFEYEVDGDEITMSMEMFGEKSDAKGTFEIDGDTLTLKMDDETVELKRAD